MGEARERAAGSGSATDALVGALVAGKYQVEERRASGGMGIIYRALQQPLDREVALKVLDLRHGEVDPGFEKRFLLEAATCAKLSHPNIVVVHDYGRLEPEQGGQCFIAMELIHGRTIHEAVREDGPFDAPRALRVTRDIARALRAAHRAEVIHRDLKPANVMLEDVPDGERVKVLDFGLVKVLRDDAEQITQEGEFLGSPKYVAPEQVEHADVDVRTDIYSLGALVYLMLTGRPPFVRDDAMGRLLAHLHDPVPPMAEHGVEVPAALEQVVRRCLEKSPGDRYESAEALLEALADVWTLLPSDPRRAAADAWEATSSNEAMELRGDAAPVAATIEGAPRASTARRMSLALIGIGVLALAVVGTLALERRASDPAAPSTPVPAVAEPSAPDPVEEDPPVPEVPLAFSLRVESTPTDASVSRDGVEIGTTPVVLELVSAELALAPITLTITLPNHHPFVMTQGPLGLDSRVHARLVPVARTPRNTPREETEVAPPEVPPAVLPWARPNPY